MHSVKVKINLAPYDVTQFDSIQEALQTIPEHVVLRWINYAWRMYYVTTVVNCEREARKEKGR